MDERDYINQALREAHMQGSQFQRSKMSFVLALCYIAVAALILGVGLNI